MAVIYGSTLVEKNEFGPLFYDQLGTFQTLNYDQFVIDSLFHAEFKTHFLS